MRGLSEGLAAHFSTAYSVYSSPSSILLFDLSYSRFLSLFFISSDGLVMGTVLLQYTIRRPLQNTVVLYRPSFRIRVFLPTILTTFVTVFFSPGSPTKMRFFSPGVYKSTTIFLPFLSWCNLLETQRVEASKHSPSNRNLY